MGSLSTHVRRYPVATMNRGISLSADMPQQMTHVVPREWDLLLFRRLQPWGSASTPPSGHMEAYDAYWPSSQEQDGRSVILVRRSWSDHSPVASIWMNPGASGSPRTYRWLIPESDDFGQSTHFELAMDAVDDSLQRQGWSSAPPLLTDVLGDLRHNVQESLSQCPVLRANWHGSTIWFELVNGTCVGVAKDSTSQRYNVVVRQPSSAGASQEQGFSAGMLVAGLFGAAVAWYTGVFTGKI